MQRDEVLVEIETDKVVLEVPASEAGILDAIVEEGARPCCLASCSAASVRATAPASRPLRRAKKRSHACTALAASLEEESNDALSPAIRRLIAEHDLDAGAIKGHRRGWPHPA